MENEVDPKAALNKYITAGFDYKRPSYSLNARWGELRGIGQESQNSRRYFEKCPACSPNNIIEMILDFDYKGDKNKCELKFVVNEIDYGTAFLLNKIDYRAVVCMYGGYGKCSMELQTYDSIDS